MGDSIAEFYEKDQNAMFWRRPDNERREIGLFIGHVIADRLDIPRTPEGKETIILSAASNVGLMEQGIQEQAGDKFLVVANDFANIPRVSGVQPLRSDARELPVSDGSIPCIVDITGALWHQLAEDKHNGTDAGIDAVNALKILDHYLTKLQPNGVMVVDDERTGQLINLVFGSKDLKGFSKPVLIGDENFKLRVYRKI